MLFACKNVKEVEIKIGVKEKFMIDSLKPYASKVKTRCELKKLKSTNLIKFETNLIAYFE